MMARSFDVAGLPEKLPALAGLTRDASGGRAFALFGYVSNTTNADGNSRFIGFASSLIRKKHDGKNGVAQL
jgi:hypothetical protein